MRMCMCARACTLVPRGCVPAQPHTPLFSYVPPGCTRLGGTAFLLLLPEQTPWDAQPALLPFRHIPGGARPSSFPLRQTPGGAWLSFPPLKQTAGGLPASLRSFRSFQSFQTDPSMLPACSLSDIRWGTRPCTWVAGAPTHLGGRHTHALGWQAHPRTWVAGAPTHLGGRRTHALGWQAHPCTWVAGAPTHLGGRHIHALGWKAHPCTWVAGTPMHLGGRHTHAPRPHLRHIPCTLGRHLRSPRLVSIPTCCARL